MFNSESEELKKVIAKELGVDLLNENAENAEAVSRHLDQWTSLVNGHMKNRFLHEPNTPETQQRMVEWTKDYLRTHLNGEGFQIDNKNLTFTFTPDMPADSITVNIEGIKIYNQ